VIWVDYLVKAVLVSLESKFDFSDLAWLSLTQVDLAELKLALIAGKKRTGHRRVLTIAQAQPIAVTAANTIWCILLCIRASVCVYVCVCE
jgi:hypothetical protein